MSGELSLNRILSRADEFFAKNDLAGAEEHLNYWLSEAKRLGNRGVEASILNELLGVFRKQGRKDEAYDTVARVSDVLSDLDGSDPVFKATVYLNCATVYLAFDEPSRALELFSKVSPVYEEHLRGDDFRLGSLYNNMAAAYSAQKDYEKAADMYKSALSVMKSVPHSHGERAITYLNLANVYEGMLGLEEASEKIDDCVSRAAALLDDESALRDGNYAFSCVKCAPVFDYYGYFAYARDLEKRAEEIYAGA